VKELAKKADVHSVDKFSGRSALHKAAFWGHAETVKFLLDECKLDVNAKDVYGDTPLHDAVKFYHPSVVEILVARKADVNIKNKEGKDPVALAVDDKLANLLQRLHGSKL